MSIEASGVGVARKLGISVEILINVKKVDTKVKLLNDNLYDTQLTQLRRNQTLETSVVKSGIPAVFMGSVLENNISSINFSLESKCTKATNCAHPALSIGSLGCNNMC